MRAGEIGSPVVPLSDEFDGAFTDGSGPPLAQPTREPWQGMGMDRRGGAGNIAPPRPRFVDRDTAGAASSFVARSCRRSAARGVNLFSEAATRHTSI